MICGLVNKLKRSAKPLSLGLNTEHRQTGESIMNTYGNRKKSILNKSIVIISSSIISPPGAPSIKAPGSAGDMQIR